MTARRGAIGEPAQSLRVDHLDDVASLSESKNETMHENVRCLACGKRLETQLSGVGSLRCLDCRDRNAPLDPELVTLWQKRGSHF